MVHLHLIEDAFNLDWVDLEVLELGDLLEVEEMIRVSMTIMGAERMAQKEVAQEEVVQMEVVLEVMDQMMMGQVELKGQQ